MRASATRTIVYVVLALLLASLFPLFGVRQAAAAQVTQVTLTPTDDDDIDSAFPNDYYSSSGGVYVLNYYLASSRQIQGWLKFDISSIPSGATITSATLALILIYTRVNTDVGVYLASDNSWSENGMTWNNAPRNSVSSSYTDSKSVTNSTTSYAWNVTPIVAAVNPTQNSVTLVLQPPSSQNLNINGWTVFYSKEGGGGSSRPSLTITYSYASTSVSLSNSSIQYGSSVTIFASTDPVQTTGTMTLQYSTDQASWINIASQTGGTYTYNWNPPFAGSFYVRAVWSTSWSGGSYSSISGFTTLVVSKAPSSVQLSLSAGSISLTESVTLTVSISPQASDGTVSIQYSTDGVSWTQLVSGVPSSGTFVYSWSPGVIGTFYLKADWSGDNNYGSSTSPQTTLIVGRITTAISLNTPATTRLDDTIVITAILRDDRGNPIAGATITFQLDSRAIGTAVTSSSGAATLTYKLSVNAAFHTITASYAGSDRYYTASAQTGLVVNPWKLVITSDVPEVPLVMYNNLNYTTDVSGRVMISVNSTGAYSLSVNSPLLISTGTRVVFVKWGDDSTSMSKTIKVDSDVSLSVITKVQYYLTIRSSYVVPKGEGWYDSGSNAQFSVQSPVNQGNGTRRVFTEWEKDDHSFVTSTDGSLQIIGPTTLSAEWKKQYSFDVASSYGNPTGGGWYDAGSTVTGSVESPFSTTTGTRYLTTDFAGTGAAPQSGIGTNATFTLTAPSILTFHWKTQYLVFTANGGGDVSAGGWFDEGAEVTVVATSPSNEIQNTSRMIFIKWAGATNSTATRLQFTADELHNLTAIWKMQYYVWASSSMGEIQGEGWYDEGSTATIQVSPTSFGFLIQQVFDGWGEGVKTQDGAATFVVNGPTNLQAAWRTDYAQLIILVAAIIAAGGLGAFVRVRKKKPTVMEQPTTVSEEPQPEVGTSVYRSFPCPSCGFENPADATYCGSCGAALGSQKN